MCFSSNFIEAESSRLTEQIRNYSVYKFVGVGYFGEDSQPQNLNSESTPVKRMTLITKVFLEDKDGMLYTIEPNSNGLSFAKGEISYSKYNKLQRREDKTVYISFLGMIIFLCGSMYLLSKFI